MKSNASISVNITSVSAKNDSTNNINSQRRCKLRYNCNAITRTTGSYILGKCGYNKRNRNKHSYQAIPIPTTTQIFTTPTLTHHPHRTPPPHHPPPIPVRPQPQWGGGGGGASGTRNESRTATKSWITPAVGHTCLKRGRGLFKKNSLTEKLLAYWDVFLVAYLGLPRPPPHKTCVSDRGCE